jgi:drug/metabolite transporter (DMT)-like permease
MILFAARSVLHIRWANVTLAAWGSLAFMVVLGTVVAYLFYAFALTELSASRVAAFAYLQPVVAALLGVWLLGERITLRVVAGGALILLGVFLAERERGEEGESMIRRGQTITVPSSNRNSLTPGPSPPRGRGES